ncbi:MAG: hypothetical protein VKJ46_05625 [Leptolyngbyaceae bacterium]|nr:hypothetical protein [Leptolyngbyaceae bacterium]
MNSQNDQDLKRKLEQMEAELHQTQPLKVEYDPAQIGASLKTRLTQWFSGLSQGGKIVVLSIGALAGLSVLSAALQFLFWSLRLAILGGLLYLVYKFFFAPKTTKD